MRTATHDPTGVPGPGVDRANKVLVLECKRVQSPGPRIDYAARPRSDQLYIEDKVRQLASGALALPPWFLSLRFELLAVMHGVREARSGRERR